MLKNENSLFIISMNLRCWIHPWSTNSKAALLRRWWWKEYVEFIKKIDKVVFIFWWPDEKDDIENMKKELKDNKNVFFIEESFLNSIAILNQVNLLICNDNWFWHIWAWLWIKVLSLWWTTNEKWSSPIWNNVVILKKTKEKSWYRYELKREVPKWAKSWMDEIKVEDVLEKVKELEKFILK